MSKPTGQKISKVRKQQKTFNSTNLILMSIGKSGIIKFEFQTTFIVSDLMKRPGFALLFSKLVTNLTTTYIH